MEVLSEQTRKLSVLSHNIRIIYAENASAKWRKTTSKWSQDSVKKAFAISLQSKAGWQQRKVLCFCECTD